MDTTIQWLAKISKGSKWYRWWSVKLVLHNLDNNRVYLISTKISKKRVERELKDELPEQVWPLELASCGLIEVEEIGEP